MDAEGARRLLATGDPLADGEVLATRLLRIDEAERIREALRETGIASQLRLVGTGAYRGGAARPGPRDPLRRDGPNSPLRPAWNVVVPSVDLARARAVAEQEAGTDVDGRPDTAEIAAGAPPRPTPVAPVVLPWAEAWALVEELGRRGIPAAVGDPVGDGDLDERDAPVLVLPDDVERAATLVPSEGG